MSLAIALAVGSAGVVGAEDAEPPAQPATGAASAEPAQRDWWVRFHWSEGLHYEIGRRLVSLEGVGLPRSISRIDVRGAVGAMLMLDAAAFPGAEPDSGFDDGVEIRRARLSLAGHAFLLLPLDYKFTLNLIGDEVSLYEAWLGVSPGGGIDRLRAGLVEVPLTLEKSTSSHDTTFMENGSPVEAFATNPEAGLAISGWWGDERLTWALGAFSLRAFTDDGDASQVLARLAGRVTWLPVLEGEGAGTRLLHVGLSGSYAYAGAGGIQYRSRPESHLAPYVVDTGELTGSNHAGVLGLEVASVVGPLSLQGELLGARLGQEAGGPLTFWGVYLYGSFFLTGEARSYDRRGGAFGPVGPRRPVTRTGGGLGAWEVAARFSRLDLNDGAVAGGRMNDLTLGVNWYLNSHVQLRFNYVRSNFARGDTRDIANILETRLYLGF